MQQVINKESMKIPLKKNKIDSNMEKKRITNPQEVSEILCFFFFSRIEEKLQKQRENSSVTAKNKQFF
jgi:hypothetical protein